MSKFPTNPEYGHEVNKERVINFFQRVLPSIAKGLIWRSLVTKSKDINVYNRNF